MSELTKERLVELDRLAAECKARGREFRDADYLDTIAARQRELDAANAKLDRAIEAIGDVMGGADEDNRAAFARFLEWSATFHEMKAKLATAPCGKPGHTMAAWIEGAHAPHEGDTVHKCGVGCKPSYCTICAAEAAARLEGEATLLPKLDAERAQVWEVAHKHYAIEIAKREAAAVEAFANIVATHGPERLSVATGNKIECACGWKSDTIKPPWNKPDDETACWATLWLRWGNHLRSLASTSRETSRSELARQIDKAAAVEAFREKAATALEEYEFKYDGTVSPRQEAVALIRSLPSGTEGR